MPIKLYRPTGGGAALAGWLWFALVLGPEKGVWFRCQVAPGKPSLASALPAAPFSAPTGQAFHGGQ